MNALRCSGTCWSGLLITLPIAPLIGVPVAVESVLNVIELCPLRIRGPVMILIQPRAAVLIG